ncbi:MAG: hypothetical protein R2735_11795 [Microthrixaceae bacterium]
MSIRSWMAMAVRGNFDEWSTMFLDAVTTQASDAIQRSEKLMDLRDLVSYPAVCKFEVVPRLQVEPELRLNTEVTA